MIQERLRRLREKMKTHGIDAVLVPTDDFHSSEYVGDYFKCRKYITGFTGSAGTALIFMDEAGLWTDGRYFIQAAAELEGTGVTLFRDGEEGVPSYMDYLAGKMKEGQTLAYDGRTLTASIAQKLADKLEGCKVRIREDLDLVGEIWTDRPPMDPQPVWELEARWTGKSRAEKCAFVRREMEEKQADVLLVTSLDDIAWLLNLRGNDIHCCPVFLSYLAVTRDEFRLFAWKEAFSDEIAQSLRADGIKLCPYEDIYAYASGLTPPRRVMLCREKTNSLLVHSLPEGTRIVDGMLPTTLPKACKNQTEVENMRQAHIRDGIAVTRFIYWLKKNVGEKTITELSAAEKLFELRSGQPDFVGNSFDPIIAYGAHAAICHYSPSAESDLSLQPKGLVLADTGGHYLQGTTDITRTIALGELTQEEKVFFTAVLAGHLDLAAARFRKGLAGYDLDILARAPLWQLGADYDHGTGHGVGYLLNVHEGPQRIHWRIAPDAKPGAPLEEGMITSDEPGYYAEGRFGIRHENLLVCRRAEAASVEGIQAEPEVPLLCFEPLTMVPFDREAILPDRLTDGQRERLNAYHEQVYQTIAPYLEGEEREWLREVTGEI